MLENLLQGAESTFETGLRTELRAHENCSRYVSILKGDLTTNSKDVVSGVSARVCKNGRYGFASSAECSAESIKAVVKAAAENAAFMARRVGPKEIKSIQLPKISVPMNKAIIDTEQGKMIEACRTVDDYIVKKYPKLVSRWVAAYDESAEKLLKTSDAGNGHMTMPRCRLMFTLTAETNDGIPVELFDMEEGYGGFGENFDDLTPVYEKIDKLYLKLMDKREGVYAEAGYKTVVLDGTLAGMLSHEAVGHTVEADLVRNGSVAGPMLEQMVASEIVNMIDYAHTVNGEAAPLPVFLDDEGVEARDAELIRDGRLVGYMNNTELAGYYGMEPTGNARAWEYSNEPIIRMRNTAILPGKNTLEEMIASVDDGYYLINTNNGQADLTGEFMFGVTMGYEIKKGKLGRAILDTTVSGIAFDMLKTVDMISDKIHWVKSGMCGKSGQVMSVSMGGPDLRCKIMIGGK